MWLLIILAIISFCIGVTLCWIFSEKVGNELSLIGILLIFLSGGIVGILSMPQKIDAIDVYRGRTELEITEVVRDTVVIKRDTVVVFIDK